MPTTRKKPKRRQAHALGRLDPQAVYTTRGVMRAIGIGHRVLQQARASGRVRAYLCGGTAYYRGSELIEFILAGNGSCEASRTMERDQ